MMRSFILGGVLTTAVVFSGAPFAAANINTDSLVGMSNVNMEKTIENVCIGRVFTAERDSKESLVFKIKNS